VPDADCEADSDSEIYAVTSGAPDASAATVITRRRSEITLN
jgi:hypothetical protein